MSRMIDNRPARPRKPSGTGKRLWLPGLTGLLRVLPVAALAGTVTLVGLARNQQDAATTEGRMFLPADVGYRASVDRMASLGLLTVRRLPGLPGRPLREIVDFDRAALERAVRSGQFGECPETERADGTANDRVENCLQLLRAYRSSSALGDDMLRTSPAVWLRQGDRIGGLRAGARSLAESGRDILPQTGRLMFAPAAGRDAPVLVDLKTGQVERLDQGCRGGSSVLGIGIRCDDSDLLLRLPNGPASARVSIDGKAMQAGRSGAPALLFVRAGQVINVADRGTSRALLVAQPLQALSEVNGFGDRVRYRGFEALAGQVDGEAMVRSRGTTIEKPLQDSLQTYLDTQLKGTAAGRPYQVRGAILLMDGLSGEIAAAATFPTKAEQVNFAVVDPRWRTALLTQNQNFEALAVGSAAKVPFYAAILQDNPGLARAARFEGAHCPDWEGLLRTGRMPLVGERGAGKCDPTLPDPQHAYDNGMVTVPQAIGFSNNYYAASLLRAAYRLGPAQREAWLARLDALACDGHPERAAPLDEACPIRPWQGLADAGEAPALRTVDLTMPDPAEVKNPYLLFSTILGDGNWPWSNVQLAQAYARIISGRQVRPRLVPAARSLELASPYRPVVTGTAWTLVRDGLRMVPLEGTAAGSFGKNPPTALAGRVLLAKTGTPTMPGRHRGKVFVLAVAKARGGGVPASPRDVCSLRMIVVNVQIERLAHAMVRDLIDHDPGVRAWLAKDRACPAGNGGGSR